MHLLDGQLQYHQIEVVNVVRGGIAERELAAAEVDFCCHYPYQPLGVPS